MSSDTLNGTWIHRSYLNNVPFADIEQITIKDLVWATGVFESETDSDGIVKGQLTFPSGIKLTVNGKILPASDGGSSSVTLVGTGEIKPPSGTPLTLKYELQGYFLPQPPNTHEWVPVVVGSITNRGIPDPKAVGTVGTFILHPAPH